MPISSPHRPAAGGLHRRGRIVGIDVARCLALLGMMATHILPGVRDGEVTVVQQVAGGRASALFAVLAGVSLVLVAGTRGPLRGRPWLAMQAGTLVRAGAIGVVGLVLGELQTGIAVILVFYAVLFVLAAPFLALSTRGLAAAAVLATVGGPPLSLLVRRGLPPSSYDVPALSSLGHPVRLLQELLLTGYYPVATWLPYLLVGMLLGRLDLHRTAVAARLVVVGLAGVALSWWAADAWLDRPGVRRELIVSFEGAGWAGDLDTTLTHGLFGVVPTGSWSWLLVGAPHSGSWNDLVMTTASACVVLGACLALGRLAPRLLGVAFGAGAMTLTLYTLHVVLRQAGWWDGTGTGDYLGQVVLVLLIGVTLRLAGMRGPMEAAVGKLSTATREAVAARR